MLEKYDKVIKEVYHDYKNKKESKLPMKKIKKLLELEGFCEEEK